MSLLGEIKRRKVFQVAAVALHPEFSSNCRYRLPGSRWSGTSCRSGPTCGSAEIRITAVGLCLQSCEILIGERND